MTQKEISSIERYHQEREAIRNKYSNLLFNKVFLPSMLTIFGGAGVVFYHLKPEPLPQELQERRTQQQKNLRSLEELTYFANNQQPREQPRLEYLLPGKEQEIQQAFSPQPLTPQQKDQQRIINLYRQELRTLDEDGKLLAYDNQQQEKFFDNYMKGFIITGLLTGAAVGIAEYHLRRKTKKELAEHEQQYQKEVKAKERNVTNTE